MRFNHVAISGRLTRDAELKYTTTGKPIVNLRLAFDQGSKEAKTTGYIDVALFDKQAESLAPHLKKGRELLIGGRLSYREWETDAGGKRNAVEITAHDVQFVDKPPQTAGGGAAPAAAAGGGNW